MKIGVNHVPGLRLKNHKAAIDFWPKAMFIVAWGCALVVTHNSGLLLVTWEHWVIMRKR
jgi:hypothetical protein